MNKKPSAYLKEQSKVVKAIVKHHLGILPQKIDYKSSGKTNTVFDIRSSAGDFIVRIGKEQSKLQDYIKEQWVTERVKEAGIPVAQILEVGCEIVNKPYMVQKKVSGDTGLNREDRFSILEQLGSYAKIIHSIPTNGFGKTFDWSHNLLSKSTTWKQFLLEEWNGFRKLEVLQENGMLVAGQAKKIATFLNQSSKRTDIQPRLSHGDLRLKNIIVTKRGQIAAVIDWENSCSSLAPVWDFSIALHDLSIDEKQALLRGYGLSADQIQEMNTTLKVFNLLNYAPTIADLADSRQKEVMKEYRLRLNGYLDLYRL